MSGPKTEVGSLRDRIVLLQPVRTPDGGGGHDITYEERNTVWAAAEDRSSVLGRLGARRPRPRRRFTVRAGVRVLFETRIAHDGETFRVTDIRQRRGPKPYQTIDAEAL